MGRMEQVRPADPSYQIGRGKVQELADLVREKKAEQVILDNELKPRVKPTIWLRKLESKRLIVFS